ncbi:DEAD-box ATP-dependent RNA helicase [Striga asiatica]|uniref:DEAD-box ATP-dependent RNA helicase n=1 Tax=Striga asiatica TaxID=4170 RepID=A0A5A7PHX4_STRAF|nr:DEAD-box ATP-dependent RNA helicase [Striga asiatica]
MLVQRSISVLHTCKSSLYCYPKSFSLFARNNSLASVSNLSFSTRKSFDPLGTHKIRAFGTAAAAGNGKDADTFLAEESVSWTSLGVSDSISTALSKLGLHRPSLVQAACVPAILSGPDVVVAAETGSGKTHGYLVPLIHKLCSQVDVSESGLDDLKVNKNHCVSLVLCPNVMLCEQVVRMANSLSDDYGQPLLKAAAICGRQGLPVKELDIIVSTPVALLNYFYAIGPEKRGRDDFIRRVKYVVFDEADLLLCGSFQNQIIRLINMLRFDEKQLSRTKNADNGPQDAFYSDSEEDLQEDMNMGEDDGEDDMNMGEDDGEDGKEGMVENSQNGGEVRSRKDWRRMRKVYERSKQYIFVAATLPVNGKRTAGGILKRMFPEANWVSGNYLHRQNPRLEQKWVEVTTSTQADALIHAVKNGLETSKKNSDSEIVRTMVFANTVEAVNAVSQILTAAGIVCVQYHSNISLDERTENLIDFQRNGGVFVCTDAAARGLDIPNISHVIQAEFASSAVDFLHRVGRTARAGQHGLVTSLYTESNRELVAAVRKAEEDGLPVENAFSRKRSFRNKLKKRGHSQQNGGRSSIEHPIPA